MSTGINRLENQSAKNDTQHISAIDRSLVVLLPDLHFDHPAQHFSTQSPMPPTELIASMNRPLSLTFQLTRGCNFKCVYCSEPPGIRSRPLAVMKAMVD